MDINEERSINLFSISFHRYFFREILLAGFRRKKEEYVSPFSNHLPMEYTIITVFSVGLAIFGLSTGFSNRSYVWIAIGAVASLGFIALLIQSITSTIGQKVSISSFKLSVFLFFILLGLNAGALIGSIKGVSVFAVIISTIAGLLLGYCLGIYAAVYIHYLGWMTFLFIYILSVLDFLLIVCNFFFLWNAFSETGPLNFTNIVWYMRYHIRDYFNILY